MLTQVIVVRRDAKLRPGKLAATVAEASLLANAWAGNGFLATREGPRVVVRGCANKSALAAILRKADGLNHACVIENDDLLAVAIGPNAQEDVDFLTGHLKLL